MQDVGKWRGVGVWPRGVPQGHSLYLVVSISPLPLSAYLGSLALQHGLERKSLSPAGNTEQASATDVRGKGLGDLQVCRKWAMGARLSVWQGSL